MRIRGWVALIVLSVLAAPPPGLPQELTVLSQEREGSATVYHSKVDGKALIIDGGRRGGLTAPRMGGKAVLEFLLAEDIGELVIVCSHPHDDHAAGIREIIRSDANLPRFKKITFVDSGYPVAKSLYTLFTERHPNYAGTVEYKSAQGADALGLIMSTGRLRATNLAAEPVAGATEHGNSVISTTTLEVNGKTVRITDFDDADNGRVSQYLEWVKADPVNRAAHVVIPPHHGSDGNDITPFLSGPLKPKAIILTANGENQYIHPGPKNLQKWADALGIENIFVTGAAGNVRVTADGTITAANGPATRERMLAAVLRPALATTEKDLLEREEKVASGAGTSYDRSRVRELRARQTSLVTLIRKWEGGNEAPPIVAAVPPRPRPPAPPSEERPNPSGGGGGGGGGSPFNRPRPKPPAPSDLTGGFGDLVRQYRSTIERSATPFSRFSRGGGGGGRVMRFRSMIRIRPVFGGIVLGNGTDAKSAQPTSGRFMHDDSGQVVGLEVNVTQDGIPATATYDDFTASELWAAYHIVSPSKDMAASHGLDEPVPGLVGMTKTLDDRWEFGVHPAIAGTLIARDAMRLDMRISVDNVKGLRKPLPGYTTYQWYDAKALIRASNGKLTVSAAEGPPGILLRVQLWKDSWTSSEDAVAEEILRRFVKQYRRMPDMDRKEDAAKIDTIVESMIEEASMAEGTAVAFDSTELVYALDQKFDAFRRIERLAHVVAVLNWLSDAGKLPPLPATVKQPQGKIQPVMYVQDVLGVVK
jgi:hypothetical protein